jgi:tRNA pseudouridine55 synthase
VSPRDRSGGLDGVLVVAKPSGPTSHDVVGLVRRLSSTKRVGHGGTLDPFAAGVLPIFLGKATRLAEYHLGMPKRYRATICFGEQSTTDDIDGERTPMPGPPLDREQVATALAGFTGPQQQVPPDYSAVQVEGRRAYQMARAGKDIELAPRSVVIHEATLLEWDSSDPERPIAVVEIACSAGTYIRALARDLGARLGTGAYLGALVRLESGHFTADDAVSFDELREHAADGPAGIERALRPMDAGLEHLPHAQITWDEVRRMGEGLVTGPKTPLEIKDAPIVLVMGPDGRLAAVCKAIGGVLHPDKVLTDRPAEGGRPTPSAARVAREAAQAIHVAEGTAEGGADEASRLAEGTAEVAPGAGAGTDGVGER